MKNVRLYVDEGIALDIGFLRGEMIPRYPGEPPIFDDQRSYLLRVQTADMAMDMASLGNLLNNHVFAYEGAPLQNLAVRPAGGGRLEQTGTLHKGLTVHFSMKASVAATPEGQLRLHSESLHVVGIPAKGLMDLFGLTLDDVVDLKKRRGIALDGDDLILSPGQVLPPPELEGRLSRAEVSDGSLKLWFGSADDAALPPLTPPDARAKNYVYFSGSDIRFGKLTMHGADLQLIDADPTDPFDFFPTRYVEQLVAGYSKNTRAGGLLTYMPDFNDLARKSNADLRPGKR